MYDRDMKQDILGVKVDDVSMEEGLKIVSSWLEKERLVTALSLRGVKTTKPASPELRSGEASNLVKKRLPRSDVTSDLAMTLEESTISLPLIRNLLCKHKEIRNLKRF
ncbi:MAG: hypothetical protein UT01_C0060G0002 [Candidatus Daviesbacteria bacterium GW2011_GWA1_38_7]|nr:MAG: hypothetical protein UT01_C0060G0002 [Candidatus Daviesbacteria bacterium GW2011_GWA1_38_7]